MDNSAGHGHISGRRSTDKHYRPDGYDGPDQDEIELRVRLQKEMVKDALKVGLKEWLDDKFTEVGRWTVRAAAVVLFTGLVYFVLSVSGWHMPNKP